MPSLKPFTALPRSVPILRSFLVPKMRTTTSSTISQCQMLSEPIFLLLKKSRSAAGLLLVNSRYAFAAPQLGEHVLGREAVPGQHDQAVKPQVGRFAHDLQFITALGGKHRLGGLLRDLIQDRVLALREQARDIGSGRVAALA